MEESPMVFEHALVNRSWLSYEIGKDRSMAAILHVEPTRPIQGGTVHQKSRRYRSRGSFVSKR